jgi:hypothetical protein
MSSVLNHQTFDIFVAVLYNIKQHQKTPENAATRNTTTIARILTTPEQLRLFTAEP